jgi:hypothetical protein
MLNITIRKKAKQFSRLVRHSALTPLQGEVRKPVLAENGDLGLTFIGHSGFFIQMGGKNVVIDPNFARWLVVLKRQRSRTCRPSTTCSSRTRTWTTCTSRRCGRWRA